MPDIDNQNPGGEEKDFSARITELEELVSRKNEAIIAKDARISELEQVVESRDNQIITLTESIAGLDQQTDEFKNHLAAATESYRTLVVKVNPDIPEELICGESIEAIDNSIAEGLSLVSKVKEGLEAEVSLSRVPAGAPQRTAADLSALSPREKIRYAIGERR